jgi:hypothetical protein
MVLAVLCHIVDNNGDKLTHRELWAHAMASPRVSSAVGQRIPSADRRENHRSAKKRPPLPATRPSDEFHHIEA